ncbi:MAG: hypothetical protein WBG93_10410 [Thermoanaerobaculia bacterium]
MVGIIGVMLFVAGFYVRYEVLSRPSLLDLYLSSLILGPLKLMGIFTFQLGEIGRPLARAAAILIPKCSLGFLVGYVLGVRARVQGKPLWAAVWPLLVIVGIVEAISLIGFVVG